MQYNASVWLIMILAMNIFKNTYCDQMELQATGTIEYVCDCVHVRDSTVNI